jgi:hypothetical protein
VRPCRAEEKGEKEDIQNPNNRNGITKSMTGPGYDVRNRSNDFRNGKY